MPSYESRWDRPHQVEPSVRVFNTNYCTPSHYCTTSSYFTRKTGYGMIMQSKLLHHLSSSFFTWKTGYKMMKTARID
jgi:hypothetical protein